MMVWGFAIPGLAMNATEILSRNGLVVLQNPGVGDEPDFAGGYSIEDVAERHLEAMHRVAGKSDELLVIGMSMGGMIAAVLATKYRSELPVKTRWRFLVTSANSPQNPCITAKMLSEWQSGRPGDETSFQKILTPFLGHEFQIKYPEISRDYFRFRAFGQNRQSPKAFHKQVQAILNFDGRKYFSELRPDEVEFIHGGDDRIMHSKHHEELMALQPKARHLIVPGLGHMVNMEAPSWFAREGCQ